MVFSEDYGRGITGVPFDPRRAERILAFLSEHRLVRPAGVSHPLAASVANLRRVHSDRYLESLQDPATLTQIFGTPIPEDGVTPILQYYRLLTGGTIQATRLALRTRRPAVNLGGGFHHAAPEAGMGFCVYNDMAVAVRRLRARGFLAPVLILDLDLHDGNGTRVAFAADATVYTFSIHNTSWGDTEAVASTAVALGDNVDDETFLAALAAELPPVVDRHRPGLVIYLAGCDPAYDDTLGNWKLSPGGMLARDRYVVELLRRAAPHAALAVVLGGGYGSAAWRYSARFLAWLITGEERDVTDREDALIERFRRLRHELAQDPELTKTRAGDDWGLTAEDLPGAPRSGPPRVLEHYTPYGLELLFERAGIFDELRRRGFAQPTLVVGGPGPVPTIRVFGDREQALLLMELRMERSRRTIPRREVLYVEWLLLQNPTIGFGESHPRLPGQQHPGLGLLGHIAGMLVAVAEALGLAGVAFVPAHYYMAVLGRHHLRFLDPERQAEFESLYAALKPLGLAESSEALTAGRVRDGAGAPVTWEPTPMVVPKGPVMSALVQSPEYERRRRQAAARFDYHLVRADEGTTHA